MTLIEQIRALAAELDAEAEGTPEGSLFRQRAEGVRKICDAYESARQQDPYGNGSTAWREHTWEGGYLAGLEVAVRALVLAFGIEETA